MKLTKKDKVLGIGAFAIIGFVVIYGLVMDMLSSESPIKISQLIARDRTEAEVEIKCINFNKKKYEIGEYIWHLDEHGMIILPDALLYEEVTRIITTNIDSVYCVKLDKLKEMINNGIVREVNTTKVENARLKKLRCENQ